MELNCFQARNGFWHIKLEEESSYLTTFNTPFGRYRWKRTSSAPEGVEVVADDLIVVGFGKEEEAARDHDTNLEATLQRCKERSLKLNDRKVRLRLKEVPFSSATVTRPCSISQ